jgi:hypothetical protein
VSKAAVKVTVKNASGKPIAGLTVTVGGKTGQTDASGVVRLTGVEPQGEAAIAMSGLGYDVTRREGLKKGDNEFSYTLATPWQAADLDKIGRLRFRYTQRQGAESEVLTEAAIERGVGAHWIFGDEQLIALGKTSYISYEGGWVKVQQGGVAGTLADIYLGMADDFLVEMETVAEQLAGDGLVGRYVGTATVNGYSCRHFEVEWISSDWSGTYKIWLVASGSYAGHLTRVEYEVGPSAYTVIDLWDFDGDFKIGEPL